MAMAILAPLDAARARVLRLAAPVAAPLFAGREARVGVYGAFAVAAALAVTCVAPLWMLALGPIVLGVPHVLADVRYLVARPLLHRRVAFWVAIALPVAAAGVWPHASVGLVAVGGAALVARGPVWKKTIAIALCVGLWLAARSSVRLADLAVAHGHNVFALALWWAWAGGARLRRFHWPTLAFVAAGLALVASGMADRFVWHAGAYFAPRSGLDLGTLVHDLSPVRDPIWSLRFVLAFAFAQSVHYAVWLRLIPEDDRPRPGVRSFTSSVRALTTDVGRPVLVATCVVAFALASWALADVSAARTAYLRVAGFHAYLEFAVATLLLLEGRFPLRRA